MGKFGASVQISNSLALDVRYRTTLSVDLMYRRTSILAEGYAWATKLVVL